MPWKQDLSLPVDRSTSFIASFYPHSNLGTHLFAPDVFSKSLTCAKYCAGRGWGGVKVEGARARPSPSRSLKKVGYNLHVTDEETITHLSGKFMSKTT